MNENKYHDHRRHLLELTQSEHALQIEEAQTEILQDSNSTISAMLLEDGETDEQDNESFGSVDCERRLTKKQVPVKVKTKAKAHYARRNDSKYEAAHVARPTRTPFTFPKMTTGGVVEEVN